VRGAASCLTAHLGLASELRGSDERARVVHDGARGVYLPQRVELQLLDALHQDIEHQAADVLRVRRIGHRVVGAEAWLVAEFGSQPSGDGVERAHELLEQNRRIAHRVDELLQTWSRPRRATTSVVLRSVAVAHQAMAWRHRIQLMVGRHTEWHAEASYVMQQLASARAH